MATLLADNFTGTDGDPWDTTDWTESSTDSGSLVGVAKIASNTGRIEWTGGVGDGTVTPAVKSNGVYTSDYEVLFKFTIDAGCSLRVGLRCTAPNLRSLDAGYLLNLDRGNGNAQIRKANSGSTSTTQIGATVSYSFSGTNWCRFQVSGTTIRYRLWADGASEPGTWTDSASDSTWLGTNGGVVFLMFPSLGGVSNGGANVDDVTLANFYSGDLSKLIRPNSLVSSSGWSGGTSAEIATSDNSDSTAVISSTTGSTLVLGMSTVTLSSIASVTVRIRAAGSSGSAFLQVKQRVSGVDSAADSHTAANGVTSSFTGTTRTTNPSGGAWSQSDIDNLQVVISHVTGGTGLAGLYEVFVDVVGSAGTTVTLTAATETDAAGSLGKLKLKVIGVSSETDSSTAVGRAKRRAVAGASQADAATAVGKAKRAALAAPSEAATAAVLGRSKSRSVAAGSEAAAAGTFASSKRRALDPVLEVDAAVAFGGNVNFIIGATEVDSAGTFGRIKTRALPSASETDAAAGVVGAKTKPLAAADEVDAATAFVLFAGEAHVGFAAAAASLVHSSTASAVVLHHAIASVRLASSAAPTP